MHTKHRHTIDVCKPLNHGGFLVSPTFHSTTNTPHTQITHLLFPPTPIQIPIPIPTPNPTEPPFYVPLNPTISSPIHHLIHISTCNATKSPSFGHNRSLSPFQTPPQFFPQSAEGLVDFVHLSYTRNKHTNSLVPGSTLS